MKKTQFKMVEEMVKLGQKRLYKSMMQEYKFICQDQKRIRCEAKANFQAEGFSSIEELMQVDPVVKWAFSEPPSKPTMPNTDFLTRAAKVLLNVKIKIEANPKVGLVFPKISISNRNAIKSMIRCMNRSKPQLLQGKTGDRDEHQVADFKVILKN